MKNRHGCLTAWLLFMIVANSVTALMYILGGEAIRAGLGDAPAWALPLLIVVSLFNVVCSVALLKWKKWGFWGYCGSSVVVLIVNLSLGLGVLAVLAGLGGVAVLYGVMRIGKENKGWPQLE